MARITVEDCLDHVANRFELVMVSSKRARQLAIEGRTPHVAWDNDKPTVVALREIELGLVTRAILDEMHPTDMNLETAFEDAMAISPEITPEPMESPPDE